MAVVTKTKTRPAHDELAALDQAIRDADARLEATRRTAEERLAPLSGVISTEGAAWAQGREADAEKAREERAALEADARTWRLRMNACQAACDDARAARKTFAHDNGDALVAEMAPQIVEARDHHERALRDLLESHAAYFRVKATLSSYVVDHRRHVRITRRCWALRPQPTPRSRSAWPIRLRCR